MVQVRRHEIDDFEAESFFGGDRLALPDRLFHPLLVSIPFLGDAADIGDGIIDHFLTHRLVHGAPDPQADGMGRADVRPRRHRGDMGGDGNDDAGRGRPGAGWGDVDDDGNSGVQYLLGDVPHGQIEAARRVETDDQPLRTALHRFIDALNDVFGGRGGNGGAYRDHIKDRHLFRGGCRPAGLA